MRQLTVLRIASSTLRLVRRRSLLISAIIVVALTTVSPPASAVDGGTGTGTGTGTADLDAGVLADWNQIAASTFVADTTKPGPVPFLYMGFVQAAVYDAVMGVYRQYEPYSYRRR